MNTEKIVLFDFDAVVVEVQAVSSDDFGINDFIIEELKECFADKVSHERFNEVISGAELTDEEKELIAQHCS